jgi:EpsI family protein
MTRRLIIAAAAVALTGVAAHAAYSGAGGTWHGSAALPLTISHWQGADTDPESPETVALLGADGTLNRVYRRGNTAPIELYVAYYARQRPGVSIHSPLHCLPGTGWEVQSSRLLSLRHGSGTGTMRRLVARKDGARALVLYGYSVHGRLVGSELASRAYLLADRLRIGRNDAGLVRIVVASEGDDAMAESLGVGFATNLLPHLSRLWS